MSLKFLNKKENILFLRNRPEIFNLGDFLCTPLHYFNFHSNNYDSAFLLKNKKYKVILGGGAFNDLGISQNVNFKNTVAWGIGSTIHGLTSQPTQVKNLPYLHYGLRDPDAGIDEDKVLPCVSCLHPLVQLQPGKKTVIFLNKDINVTNSDLIKDILLSNNDVEVYTNDMNELDFMKVFSRAGKIITNSYHISYWSLLTGRDVAIIGYSSKFRSLLKLLNIKNSLINYYSTNDQNALKTLIDQIIKNGSFISNPEYDLSRTWCIHKNMLFLNKCQELGFLNHQVSVKNATTFQLLKRNFTYKYRQMFTHFVKKSFYTFT